MTLVQNDTEHGDAEVMEISWHKLLILYYFFLVFFLLFCFLDPEQHPQTVDANRYAPLQSFWNF